MAWTANVDQVNRLPDNRVQVMVTYTDPVKGVVKAEFFGNDGVAMLAQIKAKVAELDTADTAMRIPLGPVNLAPPATDPLSVYQQNLRTLAHLDAEKTLKVKYTIPVDQAKIDAVALALRNFSPAQ